MRRLGTRIAFASFSPAGLVGLVGLVGLTVLAPAARADVVDRIGKQVVELEAQANNLEAGLRAPTKIVESEDVIQRRIVDARVAHGIGNYNDASIILFDIVEKHQGSRSYSEAVFYLADSLFQKGDNLTARKYFRKIVLDFGDQDKNYQAALQRLVELSLRLDDPTHVDDYLNRLDRVPKKQRLQSVPYVRAKYAYFSGSFQQAINVFRTIGKTNKYYLQAQYFIGASYISLKELGKASKVYGALIKTPAQNDEQKRIVELAYMALARLHYQRNQLGKAVDMYLKISRRSDLFDEALFEVSWVYVKAKKFDQALRALELLSLANPSSALLPEVRILEGNLRIRKAQGLSVTGAGNEVEEYTKALSAFEDIGKTFQVARDKLNEALGRNIDPEKFFSQITGQSMKAFEVAVELPETAIKWVRDQPTVGRVVNLTDMLGDIDEEFAETQKLLDRLQRAVDSASRVQIFPDLADKQALAIEISEGNFSARQQLATHERFLTGKYVNDREKANLRSIRERRNSIAARLAEMPDSGDSYTERVRKAKQRYTDLDKKAQQVEVFIISIEAELVAVEKYNYDSKQSDPTHVKRVPQDEFTKLMDELRATVGALRVELAEIRQIASSARDEAGIGDVLAREQGAIRKDLDLVVREEHEAMRKIVGRMSAKDRTKAEQIASLTDKTISVDATLDRMIRKVNKILDGQLGGVRSTLAEERTRLASYRRTLKNYETENKRLGSNIIYASFRDVAKKFYDIVVRADLGVVDVAWARKEEVKDMVNRLTLDSARERRILTEEFREVLDEETGE